MIGVDTNVLVRYLTRDDEQQFERSEKFFSERSSADPAFISLVVVVETAWVLASSFRQPPAAVARALTGLLSVDEVVVQAPDVVRRAIRDSLSASASVSDAIIAHLAIDATCDYTVTFDRKAAELPGMLAL